MDIFWTLINDNKKEKVDHQYVYAEIPEYYPPKELDKEDEKVAVLQIT